MVVGLVLVLVVILESVDVFTKDVTKRKEKKRVNTNQNDVIDCARHFDQKLAEWCVCVGGKSCRKRNRRLLKDDQHFRRSCDSKVDVNLNFQFEQLFQQFFSYLRTQIHVETVTFSSFEFEQQQQKQQQLPVVPLNFLESLVEVQPLFVHVDEMRQLSMIPNLVDDRLAFS